MNKKKALIINWNCCIPDLSDYFDVTSDLSELTRLDTSFVIIWNDVEPAYKGICEHGKWLNKKVFCMQHGVEPEWENYNRGIFNADYYFAWSEKDKEMMQKKGCQGNRIFVIGSTVLRKIEAHKNDNRVVYFPRHHREGLSLHIWDKIKNIEGINPIVKLVSPENDCAAFLGTKVISERNKSDHIEVVYDLLRNASCLVTDEAGTVALIACSLDIPIIKPRNGNYNYYPKFIEEVKLDDLENAIMLAIEHPRRFKEVRNEFFIENVHGDCAENIYNAIMEVGNL